MTGVTRPTGTPGRRGVPIWPATVSPLVAPAVAGRSRPCRVLAAFPTCVYLAIGRHDQVLALLASDSIALPIGLRVAEPSARLVWGVRAGDQVVVGDGRVALPHADVVAVRTQRPARVRPAAGSPATAARRVLAGQGDAALAALARDLTRAALDDRPVDDAVAGLMGAGRGLTPSGDDTLCGVLLALCASDGPAARRAQSTVRSAVLAMTSRTTSLSAALLVAAGEGYAVPDVVRLATLCAGPGAAIASSGGRAGRTESGSRAASGSPAETVPVDASSEPVALAEADEVLVRVLAIGHSSGADLVAGLAGALVAIADRSLTPPSTHPTTEGARRG